MLLPLLLRLRYKDESKIASRHNFGNAFKRLRFAIESTFPIFEKLTFRNLFCVFALAGRLDGGLLILATGPALSA